MKMLIYSGVSSVSEVLNHVFLNLVWVFDQKDKGNEIAYILSMKYKIFLGKGGAFPLQLPQRGQN